MIKAVMTTVIKSDSSLGMRIFNTIIGVAAFCTLYLTLFSALPFNAAYYAALPVGGAVIAVLLVFSDKKYVRFGILGAAALFTVLSIAAGFTVFREGALGFFNAAIEALNANRHYGLELFAAQNSFGADFLVAVNFSLWFALFTSLAAKRQYVFICTQALVVCALLCAGLYPHYYTAVMLVLVYLSLLAVHNGFSVRGAVSCLVCAVVVCAATVPFYFYSGSDAVKSFGAWFSDVTDGIVYGNSLPNGKLKKSGGMRSSEDVRLRVTVSTLAPTFYLKGFVGSELEGSVWQPTDKNLYVQDGYQGLLGYISAAGLPVTQYAEYNKLCGVNGSFALTVENVSADRRYIYTPYSISDIGAGEAYYDMGLRGGVNTYTHTVFAADHSGERATQAEWLTQNSDRTVAMEEYLALEGQYRAFVYDAYTSLDEGTQATVGGVIGEFATTSINTATQFIRSYFLDKFTYSDACDGVGDSFATEFFGGEVKSANSAYFASAATLMFRSLGFASRYVEGYLVDSDAFGSTGETVTLDVTGDGTHAWTEVYFDGIGWLPIEVTPTFFSERAPDITVAPDDVNADDTSSSSPSGQPELPPEDSELPDKPAEIPPKNEEEVAPDPLLTALEILLPIVSVIAFALAVACGFVARRQIIRANRRKELSSDGEKFGRAAYSIMQRDCGYFGGFDSETLEKFGVSVHATKRFMRITERCVYGAYSLSAADRDFAIEYIDGVQRALLAPCTPLRKLYYKFVACIVI